MGSRCGTVFNPFLKFLHTGLVKKQLHTGIESAAVNVNMSIEGTRGKVALLYD